MQYCLPIFLVALILQTSVAPPVTQQKKDGDHKENEADDMEEIGNFIEYQIEYKRYLKEVVQALEKDADFRAKLEKADEDDIRTGKIAHELQFVDHKIRTKLDELKREELERLRHLATKEHNLANGLDLEHLKIAEHLDHSNTHTFEIDDLKKLITKTTKELAVADQRRRQQFKEYEMEKKFEEEQKMKGNTGMKEEERKKYEEELEAMKKKHKDHKPLHHPGSKQQLEEVWEKQDHMEDQEFNPKTFFYLHDLDGNGFWDQDEVKALFLKELDKLYSEGAPEDDIFERHEEMERMREHVFNEADLNHDGLISYQEFLEQTKKPDFQQDEGWQGLDEQQMYSKEEYEAYKQALEKRKQEAIQNLIAKEMLPSPSDTANLPVQHEQFPPQYHPQQYHPQIQPSQQQYPGQIPPQQPIVGHVPPQYQEQVPQQQFYQPPPQQHYPDQIQKQQHQYQAQQPQYQVPVPQQHFQAQPQYQGHPPQTQQQFQAHPQQAQQQFQGQPQQAQQQFQGQPQQAEQAQQQFQSQPQQVQQQSQNQPQSQQQTQQQTQNHVPQNTQGNAPLNNQGPAQPSHNLPENLKSAEQQINQNSIPKVQKV